MTATEKIYDPLIGQRVGNGQCGALTSDYMRRMTGNTYQWAGEVGNGQLPPGVRVANNCWEVFTEANWEEIGFERIDNPSIKQVKGDDTFYIAPRPGLPTGHTGLVANVINGNITTFEQNVLGAQYVQKLPAGNSWSWYGGFDGIVRKKKEIKLKGDEEDMKIISISTNADYYGKKYKAGACFCLNGSDLRYIERPQTLNNLRAIGVPFFKMNHVDLLYIIQDLGLKIIN